MPENEILIISLFRSQNTDAGCLRKSKKFELDDNAVIYPKPLFDFIKSGQVMLSPATAYVFLTPIIFSTELFLTVFRYNEKIWNDLN